MLARQLSRLRNRSPRIFAWRPVRSVLWQVAVSLLIVAGLVWFGHNAAANMADRSISFSFSFLQTPAGFNISYHLIEWKVTDSYGRALLIAILNMAFCSALSIPLASALGLILALMRLSENPLATVPARCMVEFLRNTPQLLQILLIYFVVLRCLPTVRDSYDLGFNFSLNLRGLFIPIPIDPDWVWSAWSIPACVSLVVWNRKFSDRPRSIFLPMAAILMAGISASLWSASWSVPKLTGFNYVGGVALPPELLALVVGVSVYASSFISEIVRAAILGIPRGQSEVARSLGLSLWRTLTLVILPQAIRLMVPSLSNQYMNIIKSTTLGAAIAYPELVGVIARTTLNQTGRAVESMTLVLVVFLVVNLILSIAMSAWNRRILRHGGQR